MILALLFSMSVALLIFLLCFGFIKNYVEPQTTYQKRLNSITDMNTVDASRMMSNMALNREREKDDMSFYSRVVKPLVNKLEKNFFELTPSTLTGSIQQKLTVAGLKNRLSVGGFSIIWAIFVCFTTYFAYRYATFHSMPPIQIILWLVLGFIIGGTLPIIILNTLIAKRQEKILKQLPEILDLMCVSVQAGLTFDAALKKIIQRTHGPLIDELRDALDDMSMGVTRRQALKAMSNRCEVPELSLFVSSIIQAERLGTSISNTLTIQASNMRERRRQSIKEQALKAPVKILFPLVIFIFPALFVVILVPVLLNMIKHF
ncbi:Type II/IV secretion system protein TadC, associated with Flp pilus assembly [Anaerovibrio sp. JC8]|uniref:type II secretion system F family protein n=1 Tax=Anaerovibrio sp. JC8 TaxID=1240085 RepID=UPI000A0C280B|nr:type II secretion system F family protein [Anaerovibrio sp. JC8]ORU01107.1 Type II/IV secretion system protein TadC, associated with Flp pilus assembly [Anaerovibrio sp. JC8]